MWQIYGRKVVALTRGGLTDASRSSRKQSKACRKKSSEAIVAMKFVKAEQSQVHSIRKKEVDTMKAEYPGNEGFLQMDSVEHEENAEAHSIDKREVEETVNTNRVL